MRRARSKTLMENRWLSLSRNATSKPGKKSYTIRVIDLVSISNEELRNHFDPCRNRGSKYGVSWKYSSLSQAENLFTMAIMKWDAKDDL